MTDMKTQGWVPVKIGNEEILHVSVFQVEYLKALIANLPPPPGVAAPVLIDVPEMQEPVAPVAPSVPLDESEGSFDDFLEVYGINSDDLKIE
jgi:hypothetical protein